MQFHTVNPTLGSELTTESALLPMQYADFTASNIHPRALTHLLRLGSESCVVLYNPMPTWY